MIGTLITRCTEQINCVSCRCSFEQLIQSVLEDPHVRDNYTYQRGSIGQYGSAVWAQSDSQDEVARRVAREVGKQVPVLPASPWHDAEEWHQHFIGSEESDYDMSLLI